MPNRRGTRRATTSTTNSAVAFGSSIGNRKKSGCSPKTGGWPALIRWALTTTPDCWACRKIVVSRTRGTVSAASTSRSTSPAPTEGSWSTSLIACQMTVDVFGYTEDDFIDGVEFAGAAAFMARARRAHVTLFV